MKKRKILKMVRLKTHLNKFLFFADRKETWFCISGTLMSLLIISCCGLSTNQGFTSVQRLLKKVVKGVYMGTRMDTDRQ